MYKVMSDILPIDREKLIDDVKLEPIIEKEEDDASASDDDSEAEEPTPKKFTDNDIFEKPNKHASKLKMKIEDEQDQEKPKKKKRVMSEQQLDNLKRAREKSMAKRKDLKEARSMEEALKKDKRTKAREEKIAKREEQDDLILMKARLQKEATEKGHWDEERLTSLMEKTLDSYMNKRKKERSIPKTTIPAPMYNPNVPAHQQQFLDPKYYNPIPQQNEQQAYFNHHYSANKAAQQQPNNDQMNNLFGFSNQY
jgi:hypothetical protein